MAAREGTPASRLRRLAQRPEPDEAPETAEERCDLCNELIQPDHRHLVDLATRELKCACRPCTILFDHRAAGGGHYRLVPDRRLRIEGFRLDDARWESLRLPVEMAFFFHSTPAERVAAFYPSPMGATESLLELEAWRELEADNPLLAELEPDVEALLVNRTGSVPEHWLVPIDDCYELVGLIRTRWKGLSGGREVWDEIARFFERLGERSKPVDATGTAAERSGNGAGLHGRTTTPAQTAGEKEAAWPRT